MDIAALKKAALAAVTPGVWTVGETYVNDEPGQDGNPETVIRSMNGRAGVAVCIDFGSNNPTMRESNAAFIAAANPAAVLDLIESHEQLVSALKECAKHPRKAQRDNIVAKALAAAGAA